MLVPPDSMVRQGARPGWEGGMYSFMRRVLATDLGRELYIKRRRSIEPVFGQIKHNRGMTRFRRRGRAAARSEWRLIAATHNLMKLHNHWIAATGYQPGPRVHAETRSRGNAFTSHRFVRQPRPIAAARGGREPPVIVAASNGRAITSDRSPASLA
ncbi:MAG: transposase [Solirubrobacterales bacterium]|nr:transposase [Solirubrobacterales bacterium]MBV9363658.1 transposase [Solirubrobacterales bacterium]MBV9680749.1 transposase [Solirubrobacterales bacterium]MBV9809806.1 transposase [Solirubrobacterales bacterium]